MQIEYEISFPNVNEEELRQKITALGGSQTKPKTLMRRAVFRHPTISTAYARVRDEGNKITCTYKHVVNPDHVEWVQELECEVSDFATMQNILKAMGVEQKSYQETYREIWHINDEIEVVIDEWPGLAPFCEIEWPSEEVVKKYVELLWFDRSNGLFGAVDQIFQQELGLEPDYLNNLEEITFTNIPWEK